MIIRDATLADVPAMTETFNWAIRESEAIFRTEEVTVEERIAYISELQEENFPVLIAESDAGEYLGWALLHPHRSLDIWDGCMENTIYLDPASHGQGAGTALMNEIIARARADERVHSILALITGDNDASIALHEKLGFTNQGTLKEVSFKFGKWLDLHMLQLLV